MENNRAIISVVHYQFFWNCLISRERTDLATDSDSAPISVDRNRIRSNIRSVIDPSTICRPRYQLLHGMPPKPHNHKRHKAVIALCRVYKVPCLERRASRAPLTARSISLHNSHFTPRMQLQRQSKAVTSALAVWIGSVVGTMACGHNAVH